MVACTYSIVYQGDGVEMKSMTPIEIADNLSRILSSLEKGVGSTQVCDPGVECIHKVCNNFWDAYHLIQEVRIALVNGKGTR